MTGPANAKQPSLETVIGPSLQLDTTSYAGQTTGKASKPMQRDDFVHPTRHLGCTHRGDDVKPSWIIRGRHVMIKRKRQAEPIHGARGASWWLRRQLQQGNVSEKVPPQSTLTCEAILVPLYVQTPTAQPPVGVFPVAVLRQLILRRPREAMNPTHIRSKTFSSSSPAESFKSMTFSKKTQAQDFVNQLPSSRRTRWRPPTPTNPSGHSSKAQGCQGFNDSACARACYSKERALLLKERASSKALSIFRWQMAQPDFDTRSDLSSGLTTGPLNII